MIFLFKSNQGIIFTWKACGQIEANFFPSIFHQLCLLFHNANVRCKTMVNIKKLQLSTKAGILMSLQTTFRWSMQSSLSWSKSAFLRFPPKLKQQELAILNTQLLRILGRSRHLSGVLYFWKFRFSLDWNRTPRVSEVTVLPTEPQLLPLSRLFVFQPVFLFITARSYWWLCF